MSTARSRRDHRAIIRWAPVAAVLAVMLILVAIGPGGVRSVRDVFRGDPPEIVRPTPAASAPAASTEATDPSAPGTAPAPAPADPSVEPSVATAASSPATDTPVVTLRTVPAVRDVGVLVDGVPFTTDADGRITLPAEARGGTVQVLGIRAVPSIDAVLFVSWADGETATRRDLDELRGPEAQFGIELLHRVVVDAPGASSATFSSSAGTTTLPVGEPTWVVAERPVTIGGGFIAQPLSYTAISVTTPQGELPITGGPFAPTPEARWTLGRP